MSSKPPRPSNDRARRSTQKEAKEGGNGDAADPAADPCDLTIDVDLESVRADILRGTKIGDRLNVRLEPKGAFRAAVCARSDGAVVGSLSAFAGLSKLLNCLGRGHLYEVVVTELGAMSCHVRGGRSHAP